jgi:preprotein translocase subunit SecG
MQLIRRCTKVEVLKIILTVIFAIDCIALTVVVLMQEGKSQGLGAIAGAAESYWGKNKGRSMEGGLVKATTIMGVLFFVLAIVLNMLNV